MPPKTRGSATSKKTIKPNTRLQTRTYAGDRSIAQSEPPEEPDDQEAGHRSDPTSPGPESEDDQVIDDVRQSARRRESQNWARGTIFGTLGLGETDPPDGMSDPYDINMEDDHGPDLSLTNQVAPSSPIVQAQSRAAKQTEQVPMPTTAPAHRTRTRQPTTPRAAAQKPPAKRARKMSKTRPAATTKEADDTTAPPPVTLVEADKALERQTPTRTGRRVSFSTPVVSNIPQPDYDRDFPPLSPGDEAVVTTRRQLQELIASSTAAAMAKLTGQAHNPGT
ncbi:hypothetical protein DFH07DRAFT_913557 [Mycena maculata]|uniref:Uncharacterized protein n=1 Tax=Mycena maculata TaxID=230809 RepID=A0AAD7NS75_9AGAR|nr:hypothetical protein DFH07DRAFT_913557 [Mycena maculata]